MFRNQTQQQTSRQLSPSGRFGADHTRHDAVVFGPPPPAHQRTTRPATEQNADAVTEDRRHLASLTLTRRVRDRGRLQWYVGYADYDQTFRDLQATPSRQYHNTYVDRTLTSRLDLELFDMTGATGTIGGEIQLERLRHSDHLRPQIASGLTRRTTTSLYGLLHHGAELKGGHVDWQWDMQAGLRYDRSLSQPEDETPTYPWLPPRHSTQTERYSPQISVSITAAGPARLTLRADHGQSFRLPSLNALFWKGNVQAAGNPDLRPENSVHSGLAAELHLQFGVAEIEAGVTYHYSHVSDLITWVQSGPQGVWKPVNIGRARIRGREDFIAVRLWRGKLTLSYQNSLLDARNHQTGHNSYDKWLTYRPHATTKLTADLRASGFFAGYRVRLVGRRYANEANTKWYEGYRVDDFNIGCEWSWLDCWQVRLEYRAENVLGEEYVLISQHPMPGVEHNVSLQVKYGL
ncbi:MAG: TonB-dependent receptor [bacterium]